MICAFTGEVQGGAMDFGQCKPEDPGFWRDPSQTKGFIGGVLLRLKATPAGSAGPHRMAYLRDGVFVELGGPATFQPDTIEAWAWEPAGLGGWPMATLGRELVDGLHMAATRLMMNPPEPPPSHRASHDAFLAVDAVLSRHPAGIAERMVDALARLSRRAGFSDPDGWTDLRRALFRARALHPEHIAGPAQLLAVAMEEAGEVAEAELGGRAPCVRRELADLGAVLVRALSEPFGQAQGEGAGKAGLAALGGAVTEGGAA